MDIVKAVMIIPPRTTQETHYIGQKVVDHRSLWERILNINHEKIVVHQEDLIFRGRKENTKCALSFAYKNDLQFYKKIREVRTERFILFGVTPLNWTRVEGVVFCSVDYFCNIAPLNEQGDMV